VKKVLEEIHFQQSGLTEAGAAQVGKMLNASAVLIVSIKSATVRSEPTGWVINGRQQERHESQCSMSARLISVEKAEILGISSFTMRAFAQTRDDVSPAVVGAARVVAEAIPTRGAK